MSNNWKAILRLPISAGDRRLLRVVTWGMQSKSVGERGRTHDFSQGWEYLVTSLVSEELEMNHE